jgi:hypothetical protein
VGYNRSNFEKLVNSNFKIFLSNLTYSKKSAELRKKIEIMTKKEIHYNHKDLISTFNKDIQNIGKGTCVKFLLKKLF